MGKVSEIFGDTEGMMALKGSVIMKEQSFAIYNEKYVHLNGDIDKEGCLHLDSEVYGEDYDSEMHYTFSKTETDRLFSIISLEEFIALCRDQHLRGMEQFLKNNHIHYDSIGF